MMRFSQGEARIFTKGKSSPKNPVKTVGLLETSMRFQGSGKIKGFAFLNPDPLVFLFSSLAAPIGAHAAYVLERR
jgi:hypothetical protein